MKHILALIGVMAAMTAVYWGNEFRSGNLTDQLSPSYWIDRFHGNDLYNPQTHLFRHGNPQVKEVALTIDDGPHAKTGEQLLDLLREQDVRATFFVVGSRMKQNPLLVQRMIDDGHEVGNHTLDHYRLDTLNADKARRELNDCDITFYRLTGRHFSLMRPPGMRYNDSVLRIADDLGYTIVSWNDAAKDFQEVTPEFIVNRVLRRVENGSIILLHDDRVSTVIALPRIITALKKQGYRFVTVPEMLAHLPKPVVVERTSRANNPG